MVLAWLLVLNAVVIGLAATLLRGAGIRVTRSQLERFARRQHLTVTVDNGGQLIRYLATTRRWRSAGLAAGLVFGVVRVAGEATVNPLGGATTGLNVALFVGWFGGALVAEVRVAHLAHPAVRAASLRPRRSSDYLGRFAWHLVPITGGLAVVAAGYTLISASQGRAVTDWTAAAWLVASLAVAITVRTIQHWVLSRPQPIAAPDVLAADDAIRSRSLHVLAGGGAALVLLCVWAQLEAVRFGGYYLDPSHSIIVQAELPIAILGVLVATASWPPPGRIRAAQPPVAGTP